MDPSLPPGDDPFHGNPPSDLLRAAMGAGASPVTSRPLWHPPAPDELALLLPSFAITRLIGRGGMGAVYHGIQLSLGREVAIKLLPPELGAEPEFEARFRPEAMAMAKLNHPNIVQIFDFGETVGGHHYIVMEYVDGPDLRQLIRDGGIDAKTALQAVGRICEALEYAHSAGFIHRDIKPTNIFISSKGMLKIGDFGLVKLVGEESVKEHAELLGITFTDVVVGTPHYVAPEQLNGSGPVDRRADIYSLGVMFYEMLTGSVPRGAYRAPSERVDALDVRIDDVVFKAMEENPEERYQSAADLRSDLDRIQSGTEATPPDSGRTGSAPSSRSSLTGFGVAIPVILLAAFTGAAWWYLSAGSAKKSTSSASAIGVDQSRIIPTSPREKPWVPLLPSIDPAVDAVKGLWEKIGDEFQGSNPDRQPGPSLLMLPYEPPEEYDFRIAFTTHEGNCEATQILSAGGRRFTWATASGQKEKVAGFDLVGGMTCIQRANSSLPGAIPAARKLPHRPFAHVRHESVVEVRRDRVTAYVNGEKLVDWPTRYEEMSIEPQFMLPSPTALGVGLWWSRTTFHDISVREVSGKGKWIREVPGSKASPPAASGPSHSIDPLRIALSECRELDRKWRESVLGAPMPAFEVFFVRDEDPRSLGASFVGLEAMSKKERWTALDKNAAASFAFQFAKSAQDLTDNPRLLDGRSRSGDGDKDREFPRELIASGLTERLKEAVHTVITDVDFAESEPNRGPNPEAVIPNTTQAKTSVDPNKATKDLPFANSLGMKFVPVPETGVLFCIHETRFRDYEAYARENPGIANNWRNQTHDGFVITSRAGDHPVTWVSWSETKAFCDWLSKKEGRQYRLPTDAEWKYAAGMAGRPDKGISNVRPYPWGSEWPPPPSAGNYSDQSRKAKAPAPYPSDYLENYDDGFPTTAPVMSFAPNEFGLYDLGGNVWEWLEDKEKEAGEARLRRGGSWRLGSQADLQLSYLLSNEPTARDPIHGFRLVLVP